MAFEVTVEQHPGYLHFRVTGENTPETIRGYVMRVRAECQRLGCRDALIEEHLSGPSLDAFDIFEIVSKGSREAGAVMGRIAFVDTNPGHEHRKMQFAETVAVNRGMNLRVFATVAEATRWIAAAPGGPA